MTSFRLRGFGAPHVGLGDFDADIGASAQWGDVQAQLTSEGASKIDIDRAKDLFVNAAKGMSADMGVETGKAFDGARDLVINGRTVAGAVNSITALVSAGNNGNAVPPAMVVQSFMGPLIAAAVASGAASAGVGAAIVIGVALVFKVLGDLHLLGDSVPPAPVYWVCGEKVQAKPDWVVGCLGMWSQPSGPIAPKPGSVISPHSPLWLRFPTADEPYWYERDYWEHANVRKASRIELAFPQFTRMMRDLPPGVVSRGGVYAAAEAVGGGDDDFAHSKATFSWPAPVLEFYKSFLAAWKANGEFWLNGLQGQPDWRVLQHVLLLWNRAHEPGTPFVFEARHNDMPDPNDQRSVSYNQAFDREVAGTNSGVPYLAILVDNMVAFAPDDFANEIGGDTIGQSRSIFIHTGPRKVAMVARRFQHTSTTDPSPFVSTATAGGMSTGAKVATGVAVTAGVGLVGAALYGYATGKTIDAVFKGLWRSVKSGFGRR